MNRKSYIYNNFRVGAIPGFTRQYHLDDHFCDQCNDLTVDHFCDQLAVVEMDQASFEAYYPQVHIAVPKKKYQSGAEM